MPYCWAAILPACWRPWGDLLGPWRALLLGPYWGRLGLRGPWGALLGPWGALLLDRKSVV